MRLLFLFIFTSVCFSGSGQDLKDIFLALPEGSLGLTIMERLELINNFNAGKNNSEHGVGPTRHFLKAFYPADNYLVLAGSYEGTTTLKSWTTSTGNILVALETKTCGLVCESHLRFWLMKSNILQEQSRKSILPSIAFSDFMNTSAMTSDSVDVAGHELTFNSKHLLFHLRRKEQSIVVESQFHRQDMRQELVKYNLGSMLELQWNDGSFKKGKHLR